ncbi:beta-galactosidase [bacterium]|nr:beta-galactosidase [bacterium]
MKKLAVSLIFCLIFLSTKLLATNLLPNSSFEFPLKQGAQPLHWLFNLPANGEALTDWSDYHSGKASLRLSVPKDAPLNWYSAYQEFPLSPRGQHLTLSVYVKTMDVQGGVGAYCSINFFSGDRRISFHDSEAKVSGSSDWTRIHTSAIVPPGTTRMTVILCLHGYGTVWFDDAQLEVGDQPTPYTPSSYDKEMMERISKDQTKGREFMERLKFKREKGKDIAIFYQENFPSTGGTPSIEEITNSLREAGYNPYLLGWEELSNSTVLSPANFDLLILPYGPYFPASATQAIRHFLSEGGSMITIGGYAFDTPLFYLEGNWYEKGNLPVPKGEKHPLFSLGENETWHLGFPAGKASYQIIEDESGEKYLEVMIEELRGWTSISSPPVDPTTFPSKYIITSFKAKGEGTDKLFIEWQEKDGSRWRKAVEITPKWKEYYISLGDLQYWPDNPSVGRGASGDHFRPENADHISFSISVETAQEGKSYRFAVKDICVIPDPRGEEILFNEVVNTRFGRLQDAMWPSPEQIGVFDPSHPLENADIAMPAPGQEIIPHDFKLLGPFTGFAAVGPIGKGAGHGFGPNVARLIPLIFSYDSQGRFRGYLASIIHNYDGYYRGSSWAIFGVDNKNIFTKEGLLPYLPRLVDTLIRKSFLYGGGTEWVTYRPGETAKLRVWVANLGGEDRKCNIIFKLGFKEGGWEWERKKEIELKRGEIRELQEEYLIPKTEKRDFCYLAFELWENGRKIDEMENAFVIWQESLMRGKRPTIENSYIYYDDKPRFLVGAQSWWGQIDSVTACSPLVWEKDFQMMQDWGFHISRVFWPFSQRETERAKRANDALVYLAQKHDIILFATPNLWNSLDRKALEEEKETAKEIAKRYRNVKLFIIDLCNEPSLTREDSPQHREEFQNYLKAKYKDFSALRKAWGNKLKEDDFSQISLQPLASDVDDVRARDTTEFYLSWEKNWYDSLLKAMKEVDPSLLITVGCLQGFGWGDTLHNPILLSEDMDFTNRHYYGDLRTFPIELKEIDMQWLGKPVSIGECGARNHPGFEGYGHEPTEEYNRRFLFLTHLTFGAGGSFLNSWHWRDPIEGIFPFGLVHADHAPRQAGYIMRAMALLLGSLHPKYQKPKVYLLTPQVGFTSGQRMRFHDAFRRAIQALLQLKIDFEIVTEDKLPLLKEGEMIIYPSPYAIPDKTFSLLKSFLEKGGKVYISGDIDRDENFNKTKSERLSLTKGKAEKGIIISEVGKGKFFYVPEAKEMEGDVYELYKNLLLLAGIKGLEITPESKDLFAFSLPTLEGGVALSLINYGKNQSFRWRDIEIELGEKSTGFLHLSPKNELLAAEAQGKVRVKDKEILKNEGHHIVLSLDGKGITKSNALLVLPLTEGRLVLKRENDLRLMGEGGEIEKGNWRKISTPDLHQEKGELVLNIKQAERFSLILLSNDLKKAKNELIKFIRLEK